MVYPACPNARCAFQRPAILLIHISHSAMWAPDEHLRNHFNVALDGQSRDLAGAHLRAAIRSAFACYLFYSTGFNTRLFSDAVSTT